VREFWPQLQRKIPGLFEEVEKIEPSLQHGDFWYGNTGENEEGPGIVDTSLFFFFLFFFFVFFNVVAAESTHSYRRPK